MRGLNVSNMTNWLVVIFAAAILIPILVTQVTGADQSGWPTALVTIWDNIPVFVGLGILLGILGLVGIVRNRRGG